MRSLLLAPLIGAALGWSPTAPPRLSSRKAPPLHASTFGSTEEATENSSSVGGAITGMKWMPSVEPDDAVVDALMNICNVRRVDAFELLDTRWNGNEALLYETDAGEFFVKANRGEHPSVFMSEAVSLSAIAKTQTVRVPMPLHVGVLPRFGEFGPGSFMILEYLPFLPFGAMRRKTQALLGEQIAAMHQSRAHDELHLGRFGFPISNFLSLTPLNNTWTPAGMDAHDAWNLFFGRRLRDQANALVQDKTYGLKVVESANDPVYRAIMKVHDNLEYILEDAELDVSLLHGDLSITNIGAIKNRKPKTGIERPPATTPVVFDPASFFGHSEFELSTMRIFGGIEAPFWEAYFGNIPKRKGFERRIKAYELFHYANQLNLFGDPAVKDTIIAVANELMPTQRSRQRWV